MICDSQFVLVKEQYSIRVLKTQSQSRKRCKKYIMQHYRSGLEKFQSFTGGDLDLGLPRTIYSCQICNLVKSQGLKQNVGCALWPSFFCGLQPMTVQKWTPLGDVTMPAAVSMWISQCSSWTLSQGCWHGPSAVHGAWLSVSVPQWCDNKSITCSHANNWTVTWH